MRLLIVGAGATGGYFGGRLMEAGRDVTFLVRPKKAEQLRRDGLRILSPHGDAALTPKLVSAGGIAAPYDAVLLTVKAFALEAALVDLAPAIGAETIILPVLNGMRHMETIAARFGAHALGGCALKVATMIDAEGRIRQLAPFQDLAYGELDGSLSERIRQLDSFMQGAGFSARLSEDITREMWEKWVLLSSLGGITCLMGGHLGEVNAAPGGTEFAGAFLDEVAAVVGAEGHPPAPAFLAAIRKQLTDKASTQASSMFRDMRQGLPVEAEQIVGDMLLRGQKAGLALPLLNAAFARLSIYQRGVAAA